MNGSIQNRTYQDKNGNNRKAFEIVPRTTFILQAAKGGSGGQGGGSYAPRQEFPQRRPPTGPFPATRPAATTILP